MDWTTLLATLIGAAIAMSTSLMVEIRRDRRDREVEWRRTRQEVYTAYLNALTRARGELADIADDAELSDVQRRRRANLVFIPCYEVRDRLELYAPRAVVEAGVEYFRAVRELRGAVRDGLLGGVAHWTMDSEYSRLWRCCTATSRTARQAMSRDLDPRQRAGRSQLSSDEGKAPETGAVVGAETIPPPQADDPEPAR